MLGKSRLTQGYEGVIATGQTDELETIDRENGNRIWVLSTPIITEDKEVIRCN